MKTVRSKRMCRVLESRGWVVVRHRFYRHADSPRLVNVPVHGNEDLRPGTQRDVMTKAGLTDSDL